MKCLYSNKWRFVIHTGCICMYICVWLRYVGCFVFIRVLLCFPFPFHLMLSSPDFTLNSCVIFFLFRNSYSFPLFFFSLSLSLFPVLSPVHGSLCHCSNVSACSFFLFLLLLKWKLSTMICKVGLFILFLFECLFFLSHFLCCFLCVVFLFSGFWCVFHLVGIHHNSICYRLYYECLRLFTIVFVCISMCVFFLSQESVSAVRFAVKRLVSSKPLGWNYSCITEGVFIFVQTLLFQSLLLFSFESTFDAFLF